MVLDSKSTTWEAIRGATKKLLTTNSCQTWGEFKTGVAESLEVSVESLKPWKTQMKQFIAQGGEERESDSKSDDEGDDEDEGEVDNESEKGAESEADESGGDSDEARSKADDESATHEAHEQEDSTAMKAYKQMCRAMNLGPAPHKGLKDMSRIDAEATLRERLIDAGARFKGKFPSSTEIAQAKRNTEKAKDLEGIDMGNVVQGSRRRGRSDTVDPPKQKRCRVDSEDGASNAGEDSGASDSSEDGSGSNEDSESEFEFLG